MTEEESKAWDDFGDFIAETTICGNTELLELAKKWIGEDDEKV